MPRLLPLLLSMIDVGGAERMVDALSRLSDQGIFETSFDRQGARGRFENTALFHPLGPIPRLPLFLRLVNGR